MSLTLFLAVLTLAPAIAGLVLGALAIARKTPVAVTAALTAVGALVPVAGLLILAPDAAFPAPLRVTLFGSVTAPFAPVLRVDGLGVFTAFGVAVLIIPLLVWIAADSLRRAGALASLAPSCALILGIESAALLISFADNVLWLVFCWVVLAALVWALGELGTPADTVDRVGLGAMVAGPLATGVVLAMALLPARASTFYDLAGNSPLVAVQVVLLALALALAGGAYPFTAWLRRRALLATPAGFAALVLVIVPVVLFVALRTYGALQGSDGLWPHIGAVKPALTGGIALVVIGAVTVGVSGLLALGRRDGRTLLALLAAAQVGWGLVAIGTGQPAAVIGAVVLLVTVVAGLGAMLAALVAGGVVGVDEEPLAVGPRALGAPLRPLTMAAWCIGAAALIGVPLFGGFAPRQLMTAGALDGARLAIPFLGLAWAGDALLALALVRATAPAFSWRTAEEADEEAVALTDADDEDDAALDDDEPLVEADAVEAEAVSEVDGAAVDQPAAAPRGEDARELPGLIFAVLALAAGIVPQALLGFGTLFAAEDVLQPGKVSQVITLQPFGYALDVAQWLPSAFWIAASALGAVALLARGRVVRSVRPAVTMEPLPEPPVQTWKELRPAYESPFVQVGVDALLGGIDDAEGDTDAESAEDDPEDEYPEDAELVATARQEEPEA